MSLLGRWRIVEMPDYDMVRTCEPAYILFERDGGEFAFGCVTGPILGACHGDAVEFYWARQRRDGARPAATAGPNSSPTAPSKAKSASTTATNPTSSPAEDFFNSLLEIKAKVPRLRLGMTIMVLQGEGANDR